MHQHNIIFLPSDVFQKKTAMAEVAACVDVGGGTVPWSKENSYGRGKWLENSETRLGKRLAYLLRYGAEQEGLQVHESGEEEMLFTRLLLDSLPMLSFSPIINS